MLKHFAILALCVFALTAGCGGGNKGADLSSPSSQDAGASPQSSASASPSPSLSPFPAEARRTPTEADFKTPQSVAQAFFETLQTGQAEPETVQFLDGGGDPALFAEDLQKRQVRVRLDTFKILTVTKPVFKRNRQQVLSTITYDATGEFCVGDMCMPLGPGQLEASQQIGFTFKLNTNQGLPQQMSRAVLGLPQQ